VPIVNSSALKLPSPGAELSSAVKSCRFPLIVVFMFSALSNLLMLTGSIFMLEVYDRVLPSRNVATLIALCIIALLMLTAQGVIDALRGRILVRVGAVIDATINGRVHDVILRMAHRTGNSEGIAPLRDVDAIRGFFAGPGPGALLDLPWLPFYIGIIFIFHPLLGLTASIGALILLTITILTEFHSRRHVKAASQETGRRSALIETSRRNAEVISSMGMARRQAQRFSEASSAVVARQNALTDTVGGFGSLSRTLRIALQSAVLAVGAWLVIHGEATAGIIIAGSILSSRALAPLDQAIAQWKNFVAARQGWQRLGRVFTALHPEPERILLPAPKDSLKVEGLAVSEPTGNRALIRDINLDITSGTVLAVIGASGSGKSTLARALVGAWPAALGKVKIDGASLEQWPSHLIGQHIGYLPQDVELFAGTVAENICRLEKETNAESVISAAKAAGCHQLIVSLRDGYQTQIGDGGAILSAGQRQRIALARALYKDPFLVVLDEPNSNLDTEGDKALRLAIADVRERGGIVVVISHRPNALEVADSVLIMHEGRTVALGPRDQVMAKFYPTLASAEARARIASGEVQEFPRKPLPVPNKSSQSSPQNVTASVTRRAGT
jgi:PrtD family type I secretion system ABC transporter